MNRPSAGQGMAGFSEDGEIPLKAGSVFGVRSWTMSDPETIVPLRGQYDEWRPGENIATCRRLTPVTRKDRAWRGLTRRFDGAADGPVPHDGWKETCGCGFWGYWEKGSAPGGQVNGVIEGSGRVIRGPLGFRAAKAQIVALCLGLNTRVIAGDAWRREAMRILEEHYAVPVYPHEEAMLEAHPATQDYLPAEHPCPECKKATREQYTSAGVCRNCYYDTYDRTYTYASGSWVSGGGGGGWSIASPGQSVHWIGGGHYYTTPAPLTCPVCGDPTHQVCNRPATPVRYTREEMDEITDLFRTGSITGQQAVDYLNVRKKKMDEEDE